MPSPGSVMLLCHFGAPPDVILPRDSVDFPANEICGGTLETTDGGQKGQGLHKQMNPADVHSSNAMTFCIAQIEASNITAGTLNRRNI